MNWLRWYVGTCTDAKLHRTARDAGVKRYMVIAAWAAVLEEARRCGDDGEIDIDGEWLAAQIGARPSDCGRILDAMRATNLLHKNCVTRFKSRQFPSDDSAERMRRWRAKQLKQNETPSQCDVTSDEHCDARDKQTRIDQNREKERPPAGVKRNASPNGSASRPDPRGSRLSQEWEPGEKGVAYARSLGMSDDAINSTYHAFMRYWLAKAGKDARKVDWSLTWQTWVRREHERLREQANRETRWRERYGAVRGTAH